jgi:hypothetical protein
MPLPVKDTAPITKTLIKAAISAYSIAVAPASATLKRALPDSARPTR